MAVIWKGCSTDGELEVRSAGATRRLYCDGVLHTQYNPKHILTGDVWDPMGLAPAVSAPGTIQKALVLGLGGGAVVHQLRQFFEIPAIINAAIPGIGLPITLETKGSVLEALGFASRT